MKLLKHVGAEPARTAGSGVHKNHASKILLDNVDKLWPKINGYTSPTQFAATDNTGFLGCGSFGCSWYLSEAKFNDQTLIKVTTDPNEAPILWWLTNVVPKRYNVKVHPGLVRTSHVYRLGKVWGRGTEAFIIIREYVAPLDTITFKGVDLFRQGDCHFFRALRSLSGGDPVKLDNGRTLPHYTKMQALDVEQETIQEPLFRPWHMFFDLYRWMYHYGVEFKDWKVNNCGVRHTRDPEFWDFVVHDLGYAEPPISWDQVPRLNPPRPAAVFRNPADLDYAMRNIPVL